MDEVTSAAPSKPTAPGRYSFRERRAPSEGTPRFGPYEDEYDYMERKPSSNRRKKKNLRAKALGKRPPRAPKARKAVWDDDMVEDVEYNPEPGEHYYDQIILSKLPKSVKKLETFREEIEEKLAALKQKYMEDIELNKTTESQVPALSIPINADVVKFKFDRLIESQLACGVGAQSFWFY